jgi:hypothetical protein
MAGRTRRARRRASPGSRRRSGTSRSRGRGNLEPYRPSCGHLSGHLAHRSAHRPLWPVRLWANCPQNPEPATGSTVIGAQSDGIRSQAQAGQAESPAKHRVLSRTVSLSHKQEVAGSSPAPPMEEVPANRWVARVACGGAVRTKASELVTDCRLLFREWAVAWASLEAEPGTTQPRFGDTCGTVPRPSRPTLAGAPCSGTVELRRRSTAASRSATGRGWRSGRERSPCSAAVVRPARPDTSASRVSGSDAPERSSPDRLAKE